MAIYRRWRNVIVLLSNLFISERNCRMLLFSAILNESVSFRFSLLLFIILSSVVFARVALIVHVRTLVNGRSASLEKPVNCQNSASSLTAELPRSTWLHIKAAHFVENVLGSLVNNMLLTVPLYYI